MKNLDKNITEKNEKVFTLPQIKSLLIADLTGLKLNNREKVFIALYCTYGFDKVWSFLSAGFKAKRKSVILSGVDRLVSRQPVQEAIRRMTLELLKPYLPLMELNTFKVQYARAFYDIADFYDQEGELLPLDQIPPEKRMVIDGIDTKYYGKDCQKKVKIYKLADRSAALLAIQELIKSYSGNKEEGSTSAELRAMRDAIFNRKELPGDNIIPIGKGK